MILELNILGYEDFQKRGYPHSCMVYQGKSQSKMDDDWGYPYDLGNPHLSLDLSTISINKPCHSSPLARFSTKTKTNDWNWTYLDNLGISWICALKPCHKPFPSHHQIGSTLEISMFFQPLEIYWFQDYPSMFIFF